MKRFLGIDYGNHRIGLAVSDPDNIVAVSKGILRNTHSIKTFQEIVSLCRIYNISSIILGLPLTLLGQDSDQTKKVKSFADDLKKISDLPIIFEDERFTSKIISNLIKQEEKQKVRRQKDRDDQSAILILQSYLDKNNKKYSN